MYAHDLFIDKLPEKFTRKMLLKIVVNEGYSFSTANNIIEYGLLTDSIKRVKKGYYEKIETSGL